MNKLRDERSSLYGQQKEKWQIIQDLKDDYYAARNAYRDYEKEAWRIRREKKAKEDEEYRLAKKREIAQQKMGMWCFHKRLKLVLTLGPEP